MKMFLSKYEPKNSKLAAIGIKKEHFLKKKQQKNKISKSGPKIREIVRQFHAKIRTLCCF